ncbi:MAG: gamma-glutamylcyclotransferase family protein [Candidatus Omnitrophota bacterium]
MLYFAYGSNLNYEQMKKRCPSATFIKKTYIEGYKFVYDGHSSSRGGSVANIIESKGSVVCGGLFEINEDNLAALDCYEGYPKSYDRKEFPVKDDKGQIDTAIIYFRVEKTLALPSEAYRNIVIQGAKNCGLSEDYIKNNL